MSVMDYFDMVTLKFVGKIKFKYDLELCVHYTM